MGPETTPSMVDSSSRSSGAMNDGDDSPNASRTSDKLGAGGNFPTR
jgi:hypothetical protein